MARFAFIIHPLEVSDVARKYKIARYLPGSWVEAALAWMQPKVVSEITGLVSAAGASAEGWFVGCPATPRQLLEGGQRVLEKVIQAARLAESIGADIIGLGAYTSIVGNGGAEVAAAVDAAVTTGNSYTCFTAVEAALRAAEMMGIVPAQATAAVLGATGSIGRACSILLADKAGRLVLAGRRRDRLDQVAAEAAAHGASGVEIHDSVAQALRDADIVITVTSALEAIVEPQHLRPGAVVCDVARPRDVSRRVVEERDDVLVIEGGVVKVPGPVEFHFDFGFPPGTAYACMAETMMLALEERIEDYSIGRDLELEKVLEVGTLARKHGFELAGFRAFERAVTEETIARVRERAAAKRRVA
ncbi:MAG: shikimate dehydrogenase [Armatimonadetes bacterium]|nr:shikimate dehydrogenase [Armatimonadota bacterium]